LNDIEYWIWLSTLTGLGAVKARKLLEEFKSPMYIYDLNKQQLIQIGLLTEKNMAEILNKEKRDRVKQIYKSMVRLDIKMLNIFDDRYPYNLRQIFDPPVALFYRGKLEINNFAIAIVGSRKTTKYGSFSARKLSYELAMRGVQVVSGLARGIDSIAHEGCLNAGGSTIAVLGCGLDNIYPAENKKLFEDIIKSDGLIISEYAPGTPPMQHNFPARNRIISGISSGVLVVEAAGKSGSLITASYALEQGREVFAVPGNIDSTCSRGTNRLIKEGAKVVTCAEDILEEYGYRKLYINDDLKSAELQTEDIKADYSLLKGLSTDEIRLVKIICDGIQHIDGIIEKSGVSVKDANNILFMLEMKGIITQLPGKIFNIVL
jgi:DNA processing protein